jgi:drug/metabolite transporter (DMT)-like permease
VMTSLPDLRGASFGAGKYLVGNVLFFGACAGSAFYNTYCKLLIDKKYTELEILVYTSVVASVASIPLFIWVEPFPVAALSHMDRGAVWGILELAFIVYGCSMLLFFFILKRLDVTQATLSNYALPFFIGLLAVMVLKESITPLVILGGGVVFVSTLLVTVYESELLAWIGRRKRPGEASIVSDTLRD